MLRLVLVFLVGVLVGANLVYFTMTRDRADPEAVVVFERERTQHALPADTADAPADRVDPAPADTAPEPGWVTAMSRLPALASEAVVVGTRRHADFTGVAVDAPVEQEGPRHELPAPRWLDEAYRGSRDLLDADDRSYRHVIGAVLACSRSFLETVGGFDEDFTTYGGEDWEWAWRAWRGGALLAHEPAALVVDPLREEQVARTGGDRRAPALAPAVGVAGPSDHVAVPVNPDLAPALVPLRVRDRRPVGQDDHPLDHPLDVLLVLSAEAVADPVGGVVQRDRRVLRRHRQEHAPFHPMERPLPS